MFEVEIWKSIHGNFYSSSFSRYMILFFSAGMYVTMRLCIKTVHMLATTKVDIPDGGGDDRIERILVTYHYVSQAMVYGGIALIIAFFDISVLLLLQRWLCCCQLFIWVVQKTCLFSSSSFFIQAGISRNSNSSCITGCFSKHTTTTKHQ